MTISSWTSELRLPQAAVSLLAIVVLLLGLAVVLQADSSYQNERAEHAQVRAEILAANVTAAVDFGDKEAAREAVSAFRADPSARIVSVYDRLGNLLSGFAKQGETVPPTLRDRMPQGQSSIATFAQVEQDGRRIGTVYLLSDSLPLYQRLTRYAMVAVFVILASLVVIILGLGQRTLREANNKLARAIAELRAEVATREAAESQLRQAQKMEAIGQLTGGIAHDFNNMLAIVLGGIDMADRRLDDVGKARMALSNAREGANRAADLTRRLLAFARQQPLQPQVVDSNQLISKMAELLTRTLGAAITIETVFAPDLWRIYADPGQLENAVLNLCVNARDAMEGEGTLRIETRNFEADISNGTEFSGSNGQFVVVAISDTGPGMTPDVIERAFEPFFTTKSVNKGTGLGLAQVEGFVRQTGGNVKITSEIGHGATVEIYMPRYDGPLGLSSGVSEDETTPTGSMSEVILVVDDETHVRRMSCESLRELGYTVVEAQNGADALAKLVSRPDIRMLFTDIVMPDINGRELAEKAHEIVEGLPVLFTTGYTRDVFSQGGMAERSIFLLSKPFTMDQLAHKVREVLDLQPIS